MASCLINLRLPKGLGLPRSLMPLRGHQVTSVMATLVRNIVVVYEGKSQVRGKKNEIEKMKREMEVRGEETSGVEEREIR